LGFRLKLIRVEGQGFTVNGLKFDIKFRDGVRFSV
jgi:hypothetical protein